MVGDYRRDGWAVFPSERSVLDWVSHAIPAAVAATRDAALRRDWLRAGGTWFVGVNALPNDALGRVGGGPALSGAALDFAQALGPDPLALDRAQVSVIWPGYPRRDPGDSDAALHFRRTRDAAHVDGIKTFSRSDRRRHIGECHAWLLGLPLTATGPGASPLVLWRGSHEVMRAGLREALNGVPEADWGKAEITEAYAATRRRVFETCERVELPVQPGEAYLLHRLTLHGVAPWTKGAEAPDEGRMIAYFRPPRPGTVADWLRAP